MFVFFINELWSTKLKTGVMHHFFFFFYIEQYTPLSYFQADRHLLICFININMKLTDRVIYFFLKYISTQTIPFYYFFQILCSECLELTSTSLTWIISTHWDSVYLGLWTGIQSLVDLTHSYNKVCNTSTLVFTLLIQVSFLF